MTNKETAEARQARSIREMNNQFDVWMRRQETKLLLSMLPGSTHSRLNWSLPYCAWRMTLAAPQARAALPPVCWKR